MLFTLTGSLQASTKKRKRNTLWARVMNIGNTKAAYEYFLLMMHKHTAFFNLVAVFLIPVWLEKKKEIWTSTVPRLVEALSSVGLPYHFDGSVRSCFAWGGWLHECCAMGHSTSQKISITYILPAKCNIKQITNVAFDYWQNDTYPHLVAHVHLTNLWRRICWASAFSHCAPFIQSGPQ